MARTLALAALLLVALCCATAPAAVPAGASHTETYIDTPDGERLHADVLRPDPLPAQQTPVILIVTPYARHTVSDMPSSIYADLFEQGDLFDRGYSVVIVDLRGTGGSSGCYDLMGPGEQTDVKAAVEWAAAQPWSNGRVGMYGKSYDAMTGIAGAALRPAGLEAVVAMESVADNYRSHYSGGARRSTTILFPSLLPTGGYGYGGEGGADAAFMVADKQTGPYTTNSLGHSADCQVGVAGFMLNDPEADFWKVRNFLPRGQGSTVPMLMTAGFIDPNTPINAGAIDFFNGLAGPKRLWLGWWNHVRPSAIDETTGELAMGRAGWFGEVVRFYDEHLKGIAPTTQDPGIVVQTGNGTWRSEQAWPPADAEALTAPLKPGTYRDDARNWGSPDRQAENGGAALGESVPRPHNVVGEGAWTVSPPLPHAAHIAGIPSASPDLDLVGPHANVAVNVYDIAPDGMATVISRGTREVSADGPATMRMHPADWTFAPGHRVGVLISGSNAEGWIYTPSGTDVTVRGGTVTLPFLSQARTSNQPGHAAARLEEFKRKAPFPVAAGVLAAAPESALVPPAQT